MSGAPEIITTGPRITTPRISILSVAETVTHNDERLGGGIGFRPDGAPEGDVYEVCDSGALDAGTVASKLDADPFVLVSSDRSSTFGTGNQGETAEWRERATRKLLGIEAYLIERQLYLNGLGLTNFTPLTASSATTVTSGGISALAALALAEDTAASATLGGYRAIFHVRPSVLSLWAASNGIRREGNLWLTATDNIVLPGRGYTGAGPAPGNAAPTDDSEWIYLTTGIQVHRSQVIVSPDSLSAATDRSSNETQFYAYRYAGIVWDPSVLHSAIEIDPSV